MPYDGNFMVLNVWRTDLFVEGLEIEYPLLRKGIYLCLRVGEQMISNLLDKGVNMSVNRNVCSLGWWVTYFSAIFRKYIVA